MIIQQVTLTDYPPKIFFKITGKNISTVIE